MPESIRDESTGTTLKIDNEGQARVAVYFDGAVVSSANPLPIDVFITATALSVRLANENDDILVYGYDGSNNQPIKTDDDGRLEMSGQIVSEKYTDIALGYSGGGNLSTVIYYNGGIATENEVASVYLGYTGGTLTTVERN